MVARAFMAGGVQAGDRVAIWSPNTHHWVAGALGALRAGAVLVPVSTRFTGPEALDVITRSGARALLVAGPFLGTDRLAALRAAAADAGQLGRVPVPVLVTAAWSCRGCPCRSRAWPVIRRCPGTVSWAPRGG